MKKVLFITSTFPRSEKETLAKWIGELAIKLQQKGFEITVFAPSSKGSPSYSYHGIDVRRFRYAPKFLEILTQDEGAVSKLKKNPLLALLFPVLLFLGTVNLVLLLMQKHYDVIHVHWPFPMGLFGIVAKKMSRAKLVLTFYGAEFSLVRKIPFGFSILRYILKSADKLSAISVYTSGLIKKLGRYNVAVVPYTSSFSVSENNKVPVKPNRKVKKILFVGRLIERKGLIYLIKAMPTLLSNFPVILEIIGKGPLSEPLKTTVKKLHLEKNILFYEDVDDQKLVHFYQDCDIFVLPSIVDRWGDTEGLGVVLLEAMSFKKPVIASNVGGIPDIVKDGKSGILVKEKSPEDLSFAIGRLLEDDKLRLRLGGAGYIWRNEKFSWDNTLNETRKLYER